MPELETVDMFGVEILATGGPIHGRGSGAGGDHFASDDVVALYEHDSGPDVDLARAALDRKGLASDAGALLAATAPRELLGVLGEMTADEVAAFDADFEQRHGFKPFT